MRSRCSAGIFRKEKLKAKRIGALTLIFYDGDLEFPTIDEDALSQEDSEVSGASMQSNNWFFKINPIDVIDTQGHE